MKNINIKHTLILMAWLVTFALTFDAAFGSYQESEPHAGNILFGAAAVLLVIGAVLKFKFQLCVLKEKPSFKINLLPSLVSLAVFVTFALTLHAAFGSYQESEPHAGNILFVASAVILAISAVLYLKYRPKLIKES